MVVTAVATVAAHLLISTLATWARLFSLSVALAMVVVAVLVADEVGLTGVVILIQRVGDSGVDG